MLAVIWAPSLHPLGVLAAVALTAVIAVSVWFAIRG
jgi:hypothetical protein